MAQIEIAAAAVGEVAKKYQYTLLQDGYHPDDANFDFAWSKEVIDELHNAGVKHYVIEMDSSRQSAINDIANGTLKKIGFTDGEIEDKAKSMFANAAQSSGDRDRTSVNLKEMIEYAQTKGIKVHALDESSNLLQGVEGGREFYDLIISLELKKISKDELTGEQKKMLAEVGPALLEKRMAQERGLADRIIEATDGEKAAISFGALHGMGAMDVDEYLGEGKVGKVLLTPSPEKFLYMQEIMRASGLMAELPSTLIYTDAFPNDVEGEHEVYAYQAEAKQIGEEMTGVEIANANYATLETPAEIELAGIPKAIQVHGNEISR